MTMRKLLAAAAAAALCGGLSAIVAPSASADTQIVEVAIADATVRSDDPDTKIWGLDYLRTEATTPTRHAYLKFDVSGVPAGDTVTSATLTLHGLTSGAGGNLTVNDSNSDNWAENGITWNNRPGGNGQPEDSSPYGTVIELDVTSLVSGNGIETFVIATDQDTFRDVASRENPTAAWRPTLTVQTSTPVVEPSSDGIALSTVRNRYQVDSGKSWSQRIADQEAQFGDFEGHERYYFPSGTNGQLGADHIARLNGGDKFFANWKPQSTTWAQVASGGRDSVLIAAAQQWHNECADLPAGATRADFLLAECAITFHHEPDNDIGGSGSGMTAADYVGMFRRAADIFHQYAPEVPVVWTVMGFEGNRGLYPGLWPGGSYVDAIGHNPYIVCGQADTGRLADFVIDNTVWLRTNLSGASGKPVVITEIGADLGGNQASCSSGGDRGTTQHRADAINGVTARLDEVAAAGVVELNYYDDGSDWLSCTSGPTCAADVTALSNLKAATEAA